MAVVFMLFIISNFTISVKLLGQGKYSITGGFGTMESLNGGVRYRMKQCQIGLSAGSLPGYSYKSLAVSSSFCYHFGGSSKFSDLRPWYGKSGLLYIVDEDEYVMDKGLYLPVQIGRDFNISNKFGINFELGLGFQLINDRTIKKIRYSEYGESETRAFQCLGIGCFYRL